MSRKNKHVRSAAIATLEGLESRRMFSTTATLLAGGVLQVTGDSSANIINIVKDSGSGNTKVSADGAQIFSQPSASVSAIVVNGGDESGVDSWGRPLGDKIVVSHTVPCTLRGGAGADTLEGGSNNDLLDGGAGDDNLRGHSGNDTMVGGTGADNFDGGSGVDFDTADFRDHTDPNVGVSVSFDSVANDGAPGEGDFIDINVEEIWGSAGPDTLTSTDSDVAGRQMLGLGGNDSIRGSGGNDVLNGGAGNDTIDGGLSADNMYGEAGVDLVDYSSRSTNIRVNLDTLNGDGAAFENDLVYFDIEQVKGGSGNDWIANPTWNGAPVVDNTFWGNGGSDTLDGGGGNDYLLGGTGNDWAYGYDGNDTLDGSGGNDTLYGEYGNDRILGSDNNDYLNGGAGADSMFGGDGDDTLSGVDYSIFDQLDGGPGTDSASIDHSTVTYTNSLGMTVRTTFWDSCVNCESFFSDSPTTVGRLPDSI